MNTRIEPSLRIKYTTLEIGPMDIHVRTLRDICQYRDADNQAGKLGISSAAWPLFGLIWPSGKVLAHHMIDYQIKDKRILEVGCGIALASLVLNCRLADITATDHHPETKTFLDKNTDLNNLRKIPFIRTGWSDQTSLLGTFDLIIGSDLLYERGHVIPLSHFIHRHAKKECEVVLVDPGRGHHACFSKKMIQLGYTHQQKNPGNTPYLKDRFKGQIITYSHSLAAHAE